MNYMTDEERNDRITAIVSEYRELAGLYPTIKKVILANNNKVLNCKLEKALQEATGKRIYCKKEERYTEIYVYSNIGGRGQICLMHIMNDKLTDGKRIPAQLFIESLTEHRNKLLADALDIETQTQQADIIKSQIEQLTKTANKLVDSLNYTVRDIFNIRPLRSW